MHNTNASQSFLPCAARLRTGDVIVGLGNADHELTLPARVEEIAQGDNGWVILRIKAQAPAHDMVTVLEASQTVDLQPPF